LIKKILLCLLILILLPLGILFFRPGLIINPKNLAFVLHHTSVLKSWKWSEARFTHEWFAWNDRGFSGSFKNLCFSYGKVPPSVDSCMELISWSVRFKGLKTITIEPFVIDSSFLAFVPGPEEKKEKTPPPDIYKYWTMLWSDLVPDMNFKFHKIAIKKTEFDLSLLKLGKTLDVTALKFNLSANPESFTLKAPPAYPIPKKLPLAKQPIYLNNFVLRGDVKKTGIPLALNGFLEGILIEVNSLIKLPLKDDLTSVALRKKVALNTSAQAVLKNINRTISEYAPSPYNKLPAPFNEMNGDIILNIKTSNHKHPEVVIFSETSSINLASKTQDFNVDIGGLIPLNLRTFKPQDISAELNFKKVRLLLPKLSKKSPPPQIFPDSRFKKKITPPVQKKGTPIDLELTALNEKAMNIKTNLLDEPLRLNFDFKIHDGKLSGGFLNILPLKTKVFRRPIRIKCVNLKFNPVSETLIDAVIRFPLPEYKITLKLEGPVSKPRYAFESKPPLSQDDIYAVLLFGRPTQDLDADDKSSAAKTNKILAQGILSLSVLYFLAGSPVEYVGYDADSKSAVAQFGIGDKSSLRVGGGNEGLSSTTLRRSLGKGWYIDTSVQQAQEEASASPQEKNDYGVLLERIISY
jgi:hypothetical protein